MLIRIYLLVAHAELPAGPYCFTGYLRTGVRVNPPPALSFRPLGYTRPILRAVLPVLPRLLQRTPNSRVDAPARETQPIIKVAPLFDLDR